MPIKLQQVKEKPANNKKPAFFAGFFGLFGVILEAVQAVQLLSAQPFEKIQLG